MVFTIFEVIDVLLMTAIIGFLFQDAFRRMPTRRDPDEDDVVAQYRVHRFHPSHASWRPFLIACALIAPSIVLHEMAHKLSALSFGLSATFHAACSTSDLAMGAPFFTFACNLQLLMLALKSFGFGFIVFIPGYVSISGGTTYLHSAFISFMGPAVHLTIWLGLAGLFKANPRWLRKSRVQTKVGLAFVKQINMILFIFNMLPIPGFDGFWVFSNLYKAFF